MGFRWIWRSMDEGVLRVLGFGVHESGGLMGFTVSGSVDLKVHGTIYHNATDSTGKSTSKQGFPPVPIEVSHSGICSEINSAVLQASL